MWHYVVAAAIAVVGMGGVRLFRKKLLTRLRQLAASTDTAWDDYLVSGLDRFGLPLLNLFFLYLGFSFLTLSEKADLLVTRAVGVGVLFFVVRLLSAGVRVGLESLIKKQHQGDEKVKQMKGIMLIVNSVIWLVGALFLFDNLGYDVTAIIAGLGIGGIAIALAAQNILGDLFNYFVIFFDRPFEVGDFVTVDDKRGTVEYIGIKTTRIKSITGEQLVFSNSDLTQSRIHNFKMLERRRIVFSLGVTYQTPADKLEKLPGVIKEIINDIDGATFDRAHVAGFGDFSLLLEVVYFVESKEYVRYMDIQEQINLKIFRSFAAMEVEFAYPTQTLWIARQAS